MKRVLTSIALVVCTIAVCIGLYKVGYDSGVSNGYKRGITDGKIMRNEEIEKEVKKTICTNWDHITELMVSQLITT